MKLFFTFQDSDYVVVHNDQTGDTVEIENVEIIAEDDENSAVEDLQVSEDFVIINDPASNCVKIVDSKSGETVAVLPSDSISDNQIQTITMSQEGEISMVTLLANEEPEEGHMDEVSTLLETDDVVKEVTEEIHVLEGGMEQTEVQQIIENEVLSDSVMQTEWSRAG